MDAEDYYVYNIIVGSYPDKYEPVNVAGNFDVAKKAVLEIVTSKNKEIKSYNDKLTDKIQSGHQVQEYEFLKELTKKQTPSEEYWDNGIDFVTTKKMKILK